VGRQVGGGEGAWEEVSSADIGGRFRVFFFSPSFFPFLKPILSITQFGYPHWLSSSTDILEEVDIKGVA
jgi:hypothetical protein